MEKLGLPAEQEYNGKQLRTVGIYSKNREEWALTDFACWMISVTDVALYDTFGEENICWTFEEAQLSSIFLAGEGVANLVAIAKKGQLPTLKTMICYDSISPDLIAAIKELGLQFFHFQELIQIGKNATEVELKPCGPNDLATICYTSGTTGRSKGAMLTHKGFRDGACSVYRSGVLPQFRDGFTFLSYLPLAHVFERAIFYNCLISEFRVAFYHGSLPDIKDDVCACKPDALIGVPRVFFRFYDAIMMNVNKLEGFKRKLLQDAIDTKLALYRTSGTVNHWFYDKFVLNRIRNSFGGQLQTLVSSAAPMDFTVMELLKILLSCHFLQAYGQTETAGAISLSFHDDLEPNSLGPPLACLEAKIVDVPEMKYFANDVVDGTPTPRGELCLRGSHVTLGYFKKPEITAELFDSEGWMHTGDVAVITPRGCLKIIDRIKNIFKLQHGEFVAPEKIENVLMNSPWIMQLVVYGDSLQAYLIGILVPQKHVVMRWAETRQVQGTYEELCSNSELNAAILRDLTGLGREKKLLGFELMKKIHLTPKQFTIENGSLTPTLKVKRSVAKHMYEDVIKKMYAEPLASANDSSVKNTAS
eukprot:TRINITY_DN1837_c0_g1_i5.p1 TRINITY_DN1837_c0_g1~~TRINITY_DN1837_c0_g1_i5.p1  ORF type:complete len:589 (+),score=129.94 TRINITY_DN1837_c0_g1_i5:614-2380(+)